MLMVRSRNPIRLLVTVVAMLLGAILVSTAQAAVKHVFIVSLDQGNPDLIERTDLPILDRLMEEGTTAREAFTIVPSSTLPSHASMVTGVGIQAHQVTWNDYDSTKPDLKVPTIFKLAKERGLSTAMVVSKTKLRHLDQQDSLDAFVHPQPEDNAQAVAKAFVDQVVALKPNLCLIHFRDPDTQGHKYGVNSPEKIQALKDCDAALGTIMDAIAQAGILEESVFIVTADHGSHDVESLTGTAVGTHGSAVREDVLIPWVAWGAGVKKGGTVEHTVLQYDTAATALWLLDVPIPDHFWGHPITKAFE